jgi:hypothetical protein
VLLLATVALTGCRFAEHSRRAAIDAFASFVLDSVSQAPLTQAAPKLGGGQALLPVSSRPPVSTSAARLQDLLKEQWDDHAAPRAGVRLDPRRPPLERQIERSLRGRVAGAEIATAKKFLKRFEAIDTAASTSRRSSTKS